MLSLKLPHTKGFLITPQLAANLLGLLQALFWTIIFANLARCSTVCVTDIYYSDSGGFSPEHSRKSAILIFSCKVIYMVRWLLFTQFYEYSLQSHHFPIPHVKQTKP